MKKILIGLIAFLLLLPTVSMAELSFMPSVEKDENGVYTIEGTGVYTVAGDGTPVNGSVSLINNGSEYDETEILTVFFQNVHMTGTCYAEGNVKIVLEEENVFEKGIEYEAKQYEDGVQQLCTWLSIDGEGSLTAVGWSNEEEQYGSCGIDLGYRDAGLRINGGKITAIGGWGKAGIGGYDAKIEINDGAIWAKGGYGGAGIGGEIAQENYSDWIRIEINGGEIDAEGGYGGAGIGAGMLPSEADAGIHFVTIRGGNIRAIGGEGGNGIGGFDGHVTIEGGVIESAVGGVGAAGIGGAEMCVAIRDGEVLSAVGGNGAAGIGGNAEALGDVYISGGNVTAVGGEDAASIGGGKGGNGIVTITDGIVDASGTCVGIGGGQEGYGTVTIIGGEVDASGDHAGIGGCIYGGYVKSVSSVTVMGGTTSAIGGVNGVDGRTIIQGGTVAAKGSSHGISGSVIMNDGSLSATGNYGICAGGWNENNMVFISGGIVEARGKGDSGIEAEYIEIHGGTIGQPEELESYDVYTSINGSNITITGGKIYAVSNTHDYLSAIGSRVDGGSSIHISGGMIMARSNGMSGIGASMWGGADVRIDGGDISIVECDCDGISGDSVMINGGTIRAHVKGDYGIYGDDIAISDGTIDVVGRNGIGGQNVHISGGDISAVGLGSVLDYWYEEGDEIEPGMVIDSENLTLDGGTINGQSYEM